MKRTTTRQQEINRKAARIYNLIKANRDEDAESELPRLKSDAVPVANALIARDFLLPRRYARYLFIASTRLLALETFNQWFRPHRKLDPSADRVNRLACSILIEADAPTSETIGGLLAATKFFSRQTQERREAVISALARPLSDASTESILRLSRQHLDTLADIFSMTTRGIDNFGKCIREGLPFIDGPSLTESSALLVVAILKAYEYLPVSSSMAHEFYCVSKLAAAERADLPAEWQQLVAAARHTLPIMKRSIRNSNGRNDLLRGSDAGSAGTEELLRPQSISPKTPVEELLRPTQEQL